MNDKTARVGSAPQHHRFQDGLIKAALLLAACLITLLYLFASEAGIARMAPEAGAYRVTQAALDRGIWLLKGAEGTHLHISAEQPFCLSVGVRSAQLMSVNGRPAEVVVMGNQALMPLEAGDHLIALVENTSSLSLLHMSENRIRVGTMDAFLEDEMDSRHSKGFYNGFFIFSILFALTLFIWKPSETYLLIYALHALVFFSMSGSTLFDALAEVVPAAQPLIDAGCALLRSLNRYGTLSLLYPLFAAVVHWLLYRVFVDDRILGVRYPVYLAGMYVLLSAVMALTGGTLDDQWIFFLFYFVVYLCEGYILLFNQPRDNQVAFSRILLVAWCASSIFWLVRTLTNLGFIRWASSMGSLIAASYTVGFLICINGKFSLKFLQADQLLQQTKNLNEHLGELVEKKTEDLKASYAHLEQVQREKNEFVSNIIHNLKTPLFSLQGYAELLEEEMQGKSEAAKEYLALVLGNVDYVQQMIRHLLLFSRLEEKRIRFRKIDFDLCAMLQRMAEECGVRLRRKNQQLLVALDDAPLTLCGDELYLRQAVQNIVDNAIEHSPENGVIRITGQRTGEDVLITVRDYGEGIAHDVLPHIMERCYSFHADGQKSSGLGLNIAQAIVAEHGGDILVESAPGEGSAFTLKLPLRRAQEETDDEL